MVQNDEFIKLLLDMHDAVRADDQGAAGALVAKALTYGESEYERRAIEENLFNSGYALNDTLFMLIDGMTFIADKGIRLEQLRLNWELQEGAINGELLKEHIAAISTLEGKEQYIREYIVTLHKACAFYGEYDCMPQLRQKLLDMGVIGGAE